VNKDQLIDAIGMVDEQKIRDAAMIKRTKRITGVLTLSVILLVIAMPLLLFLGIGKLFHETVLDYTPYQIARDIANANVVTVCKDPAPHSSHYTIYVPDGTDDAMRFGEWKPADPQEFAAREPLLLLRFHDTSLMFYDGGFVHAQKHDWDEYIGSYAVPEDLWRELVVYLAKD